MPRLAFVILCLVVFASGIGCDRKTAEQPPAASKQAGAPPSSAIDIENRQTCAECHRAIATEFETSMHVRSHHSRDPIYAGIRNIRRKKEGEDITKACARCHTPGFEDDPEAAAAQRGVTCATCHNRLAGAGPSTLVGSHDIADRATPAHGTGKATSTLADGTSVCMVCHAHLESPSGVSMCATGQEHSDLPKAVRRSCSSCHMPKVAGVATVGSTRDTHSSHAFLGPHHAWYQDDDSFIKKSVSLRASFEGQDLVVEVANMSGHSFPSGFPGRVALIQATGQRAGDDSPWQAEAIRLGKVYVDEHDKPTLAPYAARLAKDTRLGPGKKQSFVVPVPDGVSSVEVTLSLRLLPQRLAKKLGLEMAPEASAKAIATVSATRTP